MSARGARAMHPGHPHRMDSTRGQRHSPGTLLWEESVLRARRLHPGHFRQSASGSDRSRSATGYARYGLPRRPLLVAF
eukprot:3051570-Lingulodinium_polyedra.AAC.1